MSEAKRKNVNESEEVDTYPFLDYPHAALSPDGQYVAVGSQDLSHIVIAQREGKWKNIAYIDPRSSYPNIVCFNYVCEPHQVVLGSCHFTQSGTLGIDLSQIEGLIAFGWEINHESLSIIDDHKWAFSMLANEAELFLGSNDGYTWIRKQNESDVKYIHIGGTLLSMNITSDGRSLVVSTHAGQVLLLEIHNNLTTEKSENGCLAPYLTTNLLVADEKRYVFFKNAKPMVW